MRRTASVVITVRLDPADLERYSAEAAARGVGLSTYLRDRLADQDPLLAELASIRRALESLSSSRSPEAPARAPTASGEAASHQAIFLETLLLCRSIAQPQRTEVAQGEVARLGLPVWRGPTAR
ncbi:MAG TPA: hypothetical protein VMK12_22715 [Anaeromyxobacteraceae bacterium]|nr:hypothetical protein [Anaeromyxobacteraceae bacterium]